VAGVAEAGGMGEVSAREHNGEEVQRGKPSFYSPPLAVGFKNKQLHHGVVNILRKSGRQ